MIMIYQNFVGRAHRRKVSEDGMFVTIKNPCYIMVIPDESTGKIQIGFQPFSNFSMENMFNFSKDNFVCEPYTPAEQIENGYRAQFSILLWLLRYHLLLVVILQILQILKEQNIKKLSIDFFVKMCIIYYTHFFIYKENNYFLHKCFTKR
jgi:hypothetical protein